MVRLFGKEVAAVAGSYDEALVAARDACGWDQEAIEVVPVTITGRSFLNIEKVTMWAALVDQY